MSLIADLGVGPVVVAPMAGGPSTPELVVAAAEAGALAFLAAGYLTAETLQQQIAAVRAGTSAPFGVNLFAPNPVPVDRVAYRRYRESLREAERFGVQLPAEPVEDDDAWGEKVDLLSHGDVPVVSFTFGIPDPAVQRALGRSLLLQTVTSRAEAQRAAEGAFDALVVQSADAGGHLGTLTPGDPPPPVPLPELVAAVAATVHRPVVAAGGIGDAAGVRAALRAGAAAVAVGTAFLLAPEAGTSAVHRRALLDPARADTVVTRAFTGRPARALRNAFADAHDADAPLGYPALHHLTRRLRRAATAAGDPDSVNLWAGTGHRAVRERPVRETLGALSG